MTDPMLECWRSVWLGAILGMCAALVVYVATM